MAEPVDLGIYFDDEERANIELNEAAKQAQRRHADYVDVVGEFQFSEKQLATITDGRRDPAEAAYKIAKEQLREPTLDDVYKK